MIRKRPTRLGAGTLALALALSVATLFLGTRPAAADPPPTVPTHAVIGSPPVALTDLRIECAWHLPDMSPGDLPMTYSALSGNGVGGTTIYDNTPAQLPTGAPCNPPATGPAPPMDGLRHNMMGVLPNVNNQPIERRYQMWAAVEGSAIGSVADVYWKVWEPYVTGPGAPNCSGSVSFPESSNPYCFKYQHHATANQGPVSVSNPIKFLACSDLFNAANTAMFVAAVQTGQMTQAEVTRILDMCVQGVKRVFQVTTTISKDQPCGEYRVEVTVVDTAGQTTRVVSFFDVVCFAHLALDFAQVPWGQILNGQDTVVPGDMLMTTGSLPTVQNQGNQPTNVIIRYAPLRHTFNANGGPGDQTKTIERFGLKLRASWQTSPLSTTDVPVLMAGQPYCFSDHPIAYNQTAKIDFLVHPEAAQRGTYHGAVEVIAAPSCPTSAGRQ